MKASKSNDHLAWLNAAGDGDLRAIQRLALHGVEPLMPVHYARVAGTAFKFDAAILICLLYCQTSAPDEESVPAEQVVIDSTYTGEKFTVADIVEHGSRRNHIVDICLGSLVEKLVKLNAVPLLKKVLPKIDRRLRIFVGDAFRLRRYGAIQAIFDASIGQVGFNSTVQQRVDFASSIPGDLGQLMRLLCRPRRPPPGAIMKLCRSARFAPDELNLSLRWAAYLERFEACAALVSSGASPDAAGDRKASNEIQAAVAALQMKTPPHLRVTDAASAQL